MVIFRQARNDKKIIRQNLVQKRTKIYSDVNRKGEFSANLRSSLFYNPGLLSIEQVYSQFSTVHIRDMKHLSFLLIDSHEHVIIF